MRRLALATAVVTLTACAAQPMPTADPVPTPPTPSSSDTRTPEPPEPLRWGPTEEQHAQAARLVAAMSVQEQAGQVMVADFASVEAATALVRDLHLGGVIVMAGNVESVFAPVADVTMGPHDPTIGSRSASSDPAIVADMVSGAVHGDSDAGIVAVAKHFPGHGSVPADSHVTLPSRPRRSPSCAAATWSRLPPRLTLVFRP
jgi:hypothetical protein